MELLDGLYLYEVVLLALGVLLFLMLAVAFMTLVMRGRPYSKLLTFFAVPIIMVGFPGIKSFELSNSKLKIETHTRVLEQDPTNQTVRESLANEVADVSVRPFSQPNVLTTIAGAQIALGNNKEAEAKIEKALEQSPQHPAAVDLKKRIELDRNLAALTNRVEQDPHDAAAKAKLAATVREVVPLKTASPETISNLARAQAALGNQAQAKSNVEKALAIDPNFAPAIQLKKRITP